MRSAVLTFEDGMKMTITSGTEAELNSHVECMRENGIVDCNHLINVEYLEPLEITPEPKFELKEHNLNDDLDAYYYDC